MQTARREQRHVQRPAQRCSPFLDGRGARLDTEREHILAGVCIPCLTTGELGRRFGYMMGRFEDIGPILPPEEAANA